MYKGYTKNKNGQLYINNISTQSLVDTYGSPLYVYDMNYVNDQISLMKSAFKSNKFDAKIAYASKAFLVTQFAKRLNQLSMNIDCVSGGELYTAHQAGFNMNNVIFHGNNKSIGELNLALDLNVGLIVVDSIYELEVLNSIVTQPTHLLLRVNPGIEAHTHEYIMTASLTSKFGESIYDHKTLLQIIHLIQSNDNLILDGFHCHIGSQIFDEKPFYKTIEVMTKFIKQMETSHNLTFNTLNLGGGFGVPYTSKDPNPDIKHILETIIKETESQIEKQSLSIKTLIIEPGRSIVANAGITLYKVGYQKQTYGKKDYIFVDGGMSDNIRPALYQATYEADIATNLNDHKAHEVTIAGKLCESGDVLIEGSFLQKAVKDDILVVYSTGAYGHSMSSNYNKMLKPAVVFVEDETSTLVVKRETYQDLIKNDL